MHYTTELTWKTYHFKIKMKNYHFLFRLKRNETFVVSRELARGNASGKSHFKPLYQIHYVLKITALIVDNLLEMDAERNNGWTASKGLCLFFICWIYYRCIYKCI